MKEIKLTQSQKDVIMLMYRAYRYFEIKKKNIERLSEEEFVKDIEKVINNKDL